MLYVNVLLCYVLSSVYKCCMSVCCCVMCYVLSSAYKMLYVNVLLCYVLSSVYKCCMSVSCCVMCYRLYINVVCQCVAVLCVIFCI